MTVAIQETQPRPNRRFAQCAILGTAGAAMIGDAQYAEASIVYSNPVNINIPSNTTGVYLNVVTGATSTSGSFAGFDVNPWSGSGLSFFATSGVQHGTVLTGANAANLAPGTSINSGSTYGTNPAASTSSALPFVLNSSNNLVGFRFLNEGTSQVNFGWMRIALSGTLIAQPRTLVEYAYENTGAAIAAGDTGVAAVPEPSSVALSLLASGAVGLAAWRRRRANNDAAVAAATE